MVRNMVKKLRKLISSIAVFVTIWALLACAITILWWIIPICSEQIMLFARWIISAFFLIWFLLTRRLSIN